MRNVTKQNAKNAVGDRHLSLFPQSKFRKNHPYYFKHWRDALIDGASAEAIEKELNRGSGNELNGNPPKFCAAYSSSALCVNSFSAVQANPSLLEFGGHRNFTKFGFEQKLPTGLQGTAPTLDFTATSQTCILGLESKFLETFDNRKPAFVEKYQEAFHNCGCGVLETAYHSIREQPSEFQHLDAAQLMKHALGIAKFQPHGEDSIKHRILGHVFWEPDNRSEVWSCHHHREELKRFEDLVKGSQVTFVSTSYATLWKSWQEEACKKNHANRLFQRYGLTV